MPDLGRAILALAGGAWLGWDWLDPLMGDRAVIIAGQRAADRNRQVRCWTVRWTVRLSSAYAAPGAQSGPSYGPAPWCASAVQFACIVSVVTHGDAHGGSPRARLRDCGLVHVTVEVNRCGDEGRRRGAE
jgi:hypothetical protein